MAHIHSIYDTDSHFSINPLTREIRNESSKKTSLIQNDHNSERFTFELPRFVEGHDMALCTKVEVHYTNASAANTSEKNEDVYPVNDMQISPEDENVVIFSWLISGNATKYAGNLSFLVRFVCLTGDVVDYAWHTAIYSDITIAKGMNNGEAVVEEITDALAAIMTMGWKTPATEITDFEWLFANKPTEVMLYIHCGDSGMTNYKMHSVHLVRTSVDVTSVTYEGYAVIYCDYDGYHTIKYSGHLKITFYDTDFVLEFEGMKDYFVGYEDSSMGDWLEIIEGTSASLNFSSGDMDNYNEFKVIAYKGV